MVGGGCGGERKLKLGGPRARLNRFPPTRPCVYYAPCINNRRFFADGQTASAFCRAISVAPRLRVTSWPAGWPAVSLRAARTRRRRRRANVLINRPAAAAADSVTRASVDRASRRVTGSQWSAVTLYRHRCWIPRPRPFPAVGRAHRRCGPGGRRRGGGPAKRRAADGKSTYEQYNVGPVPGNVTRRLTGILKIKNPTKLEIKPKKKKNNFNIIYIIIKTVVYLLIINLFVCFFSSVQKSTPFVKS